MPESRVIRKENDRIGIGGVKTAVWRYEARIGGGIAMYGDPWQAHFHQSISRTGSSGQWLIDSVCVCVCVCVCV